MRFRFKIAEKTNENYIRNRKNQIASIFLINFIVKNL